MPADEGLQAAGGPCDQGEDVQEIRPKERRQNTENFLNSLFTQRLTDL